MNKQKELDRLLADAQFMADQQYAETSGMIRQEKAGRPLNYMIAGVVVVTGLLDENGSFGPRVAPIIICCAILLYHRYHWAKKIDKVNKEYEVRSRNLDSEQMYKYRFRLMELRARDKE